MTSRILLLSLLILGLSACNETINKKETQTAPALNTGDLGKLNDACETPVDFASVKKNVLDVSCSTCHTHANSFTTYQKTLAKVGGDKGIEAMVRSGRMPDESDGDVPFSPEQKDLLLKWLDAGAPETVALPADCANQPTATPTPEPAPAPSMTPSPTPTATPTPTPPEATPTPVVSPSPGATPTQDPRATYEWLKANVLTQKCLACHNPDPDLSDPNNDDASDADFSTYEAMTGQTNLFNVQNPEQSKIVLKVTKVGKGQMPPANNGKYSHLTDDEISVLTAWIRAGMPEKL